MEDRRSEVVVKGAPRIVLRVGNLVRQERGVGRVMPIERETASLGLLVVGLALMIYAFSTLFALHLPYGLASVSSLRSLTSLSFRPSCYASRNSFCADF